MATGSDKMVLCFAIDGNFSMPLAVALLSLYEVHAPEELEIHLLHALDRKTLGRLREALPRKAEIHEHSLRDAERTDPRGQLAAANARLILDQFLKKRLGRCLYLDADVMVVSSLRPLWHVELDGHAFGAVRDAGMPWIGSPHGPGRRPRWETLKLDPGNPYFNSGVLLIDLQPWRAQELGARALELLQKHSLPYPDQDALLGASRGQFHPLHPRWNMIPEHFDPQRGHAWVSEGTTRMREALESPGIIHFTQALRPWAYSYFQKHPWAARWYELLDRTPWKGSRPRPRPFSIIKRVVGRALGR